MSKAQFIDLTKAFQLSAHCLPETKTVSLETAHIFKVEDTTLATGEAASRVFMDNGVDFPVTEKRDDIRTAIADSGATFVDLTSIAGSTMTVNVGQIVQLKNTEASSSRQGQGALVTTANNGSFYVGETKEQIKAKVKAVTL